MTDTNTAGREAFEAWAVGLLGDNPNWRESGPCELAWQAWQARASLAESAGSEPVAPEDYVPMLDDEGRMMVGTSHHYTAENIRALVQQLRRFADPQQSTQADWDALDWRGWCNVLGRIVAALADEVPITHPSPPEGMAGWKWVPVEPTEEMKTAAVKYANGSAVYKNVSAAVLRIEEGIYGEVYEAMIAAAPPLHASEAKEL